MTGLSCVGATVMTAACGSSLPPSASTTVAASGTAAVGADGVQRITVTADDTLRFDPAQILARPGTLVITFKVLGNAPHTFGVEGVLPDGTSADTGNINGHNETTLTVKLASDGKYTYE